MLSGPGVPVNNKLLPVFVAVVLGGLSIVGIRLYVERIQKNYEIQQVPIPVLVASRDLAAGKPLTPDDIETQNFPRDVIERAFRKTYIADRTTVINAKLVTPIAAGQVLQTYHFATPRRDRRLVFEKEYRAVTIPVSAVSGLAGLLKPGDYVDVVATTSFSETRDAAKKTLAVTRTLLKNVNVLATDTVIDPNDADSAEGYATVTLRLRPLDVNRVLFSLHNGAAIHLAYVQAGVAETPSKDPVTADGLYNEIAREIRGG